MALILKASDLKFKYPRDIAHRDQPKFSGLPDPTPSTAMISMKSSP